MSKIYNFYAGPAVYEEVLREAKEELMIFPVPA